MTKDNIINIKKLKIPQNTEPKTNSLGSAITRDELQLELVQAHKMEAIGLLAGGIAHDFNKLLWPILAYSETLRESAKDPEE